ncbi:SpoIIE family protein phosphatase [Nocardioides caldifontis]|uniref:SpoIIE family protein phosphatase n=1 Tax=Nocardioides caldifontis TaxID=2588938 RepID=UPI0011DF2B56|nr:SpoIIE family protein phosphatase [Nocardioides caldifontis]
MRRFLEGRGRIGADHLAVDWDATPMGPPEKWPQALQNSVRILLTSKFSMWMAWGPELTFFCNDAYRRDTLGSKYPWALGRPASEVWSEIWPDIGPRIDRVMTTGEATWDENLQLFLERSGYLEETYHTFSYSPLAADDGSIAGMLCVVKEDTEQVISARRMTTLRDLGTRRSGLTEAETIASVCDTLAHNPESLPFTLIYRFEPDGRTAVRVGTTGFTDSHHEAAPTTLSLDSDGAWPVTPAAGSQSVVVDELRSRFGSLPTGAWSEPPTQAIVVPLAQAAQASPYGFLVVGLNPYRALDDGYEGFVELIAGHLAAALTDARAFEFERQRAETLAQLDRAKTDFFTNVSHEFRTPLTLLLGPAEDALADDAEPLPPRQRERVEVIHRNGQRLLRLVNSLLDFSRLESGKVTGRFEQLDLAKYTTELATMFDSAAARAGIRLEIDCPPLPSRPYVDAEHWAKIVLNLVSNALKFTFDGSITVRLRDVDGEAELTVADTGVGIPEAELPHLFERFHRVPGARSRTHEGSGIGLALVAELVALHGGTVGAESTQGEGTTFTVRLPLGSTHLPAELVAEAPAQAGVEGTEAAQQARGFVSEAMRWLEESDDADVLGPVEHGDRPTVLVVDDNPDMREYVASLLADDYDVATAEDGVDALEKVAVVRPDLVLTDVMMPRLDGFGLLERLHADPATTGVPVIMLSARAGEEGTVEGLEAGADDYLVKPFSARELLARVRVNLELDKVRRVRSTLERSQELLDQAQRLARVGSWEIDLRTGEMVVSDELARLLEVEQDGPLDWEAVVGRLVHEEDQELVRHSLVGAGPDTLIEYEARLVTPSGWQRLLTVRGEVTEVVGGRPVVLRGSVQDITEQRRTEQALAEASARQQAAEREHLIADALQRSLLPERSFDVEHLEVATYYRAGVQGTQVGGDWYDIIELGAGRTALVVGDVMGRGVSAAAGMGQLRSAIRAFSKLDLPPAEMLEYLDGIVQDMGGDQIVTCFYAVFDSTDQTLRYANAGHLPALLVNPDEPPVRLAAAGPPLGAGYFGMRTESVRLHRGSTVALYTDGLVERRTRDIDVGIDALATQLQRHSSSTLDGLPEQLVASLLPEGHEDDIAILIARVDAEPFEAAVSHRLAGGERAVAEARRMVLTHLQAWRVAEEICDEVVLMASELVTNALMHGRAPIDLRLRRTGSEIVFEVQDRAVYRPRRRRAADDDEHGRGLHIVSVLADRWGSRATGSGKSVWFSKSLADT